MSAPRVLIVDDEPDMLENCSRILSRQGYACTTVGDGATALAILERERPDLMLTDFKMAGMDGLTLLRRAHELDPALPIIMITGFASIESAVAAVKEGAFDYLPKDFSVDQLRVPSSGPSGIEDFRSRTATCASSSRRPWASRTSWAAARPWRRSSSW